MAPAARIFSHMVQTSLTVHLRAPLRQRRAKIRRTYWSQGQACCYDGGHQGRCQLCLPGAWWLPPSYDSTEQICSKTAAQKAVELRTSGKPQHKDSLATRPRANIADTCLGDRRHSSR